MSNDKHRAPLEPPVALVAVSINIWSLQDRCTTHSNTLLPHYLVFWRGKPTYKSDLRLNKLVLYCVASRPDTIKNESS